MPSNQTVGGIEFPEFLRSVRLPPVIVDSAQLSQSDLSALLSACQQSRLGKTHPAIPPLRKYRDGGSFDAMLWTIFERWVGISAPIQYKWIMLALALLGSDLLIEKLVPLILKWSKIEMVQQSAFALECLAACGSNVSLSHLAVFAHQDTDKNLRALARKIFNAEAEQRNISALQLEDLIAPKTRTSIAIEHFHARRLEVAMTNARRWTTSEFRQYFLSNPFMLDMIRTLLWGIFDENDRLLGMFRVAEDGTLANIDDRNCTLQETDQVGIVHPCSLTTEQKELWGEVWCDYTIVPLFPQLVREIFSLTREQLRKSTMARDSFPTDVVVNLIPGREPEWFTHTHYSSKGTGGGKKKKPPSAKHFLYTHFPKANLTAIVQVSDYWSRNPTRFEEAFFLTGLIPFDQDAFEQSERRVPLAKVDPILISEVIRDQLVLLHFCSE